MVTVVTTESDAVEEEVGISAEREIREARLD